MQIFYPLHLLKLLQSTVTTVCAGNVGFMGNPFVVQPALPLKLYEFEACPYCRRVRQALTTLNLDVQIYPCPQGGTRYRPEVVRLSGKSQFPFLVDENTGVQLQDSQDIIDYLFATYGNPNRTPAAYKSKANALKLSSIGSDISALRGMKVARSNAGTAAPASLLTLWSFESSPYSRLVREKLCSYELAYTLVNVAKEQRQDMGPVYLRFHTGAYKPISGGKRERLMATTNGRMQVPYLLDPNTQVALFESFDIVRYLDDHYAK